MNNTSHSGDRKSRNCWFVMLHGMQHNLGPDKKAAFEKFYRLMLEGEAPQVQQDQQTFTALADRFLDWVKRKRAPDTYEWYRYRLERFARKYPNLLAEEVRPHHVAAWVERKGL